MRYQKYRDNVPAFIRQCDFSEFMSLIHTNLIFQDKGCNKGYFTPRDIREHGLDCFDLIKNT